jgi:hypothetical protein
MVTVKTVNNNRPPETNPKLKPVDKKPTEKKPVNPVKGSGNRKDGIWSSLTTFAQSIGMGTG